jgi:hypothetical protein
MIWNEAGMPSGVKPQVTLSAGSPRKLIGRVLRVSETTTSR